MKKKWFSLIDSFRFALEMLLVSALLIAFGNIKTDSTVVNQIIDVLAFVGSLFKDLLPLVVVISYLGTNYEDYAATAVSIVDFSIFNVITMFFGNSSYSPCFYSKILGLSNIITTASGNEVTRYPLNMGLLSSFIIIAVVSYTYKLSRKRYNYGILSFVTNNGWFLLTSIVLTIAAAACVVFVETPIVNRLTNVFNFISTNSINPIAMFIYGVGERIFNVLGLSNIVEESFWTGLYGGSWISSSSLTYFGDMNIWTAQYAAESITASTGKFTSPIYIINIFALPSLMIGYYLNINNKIDRKRMRGLLLISVAASLFGTAAVPFELALLITAPGLFVAHMLLSGSMYFITNLFEIRLGYSFNGVLNQNCAGNIFDFISYFRNVNLHSTVLKLIMIGVVYFVIYQLLCWLYYRFLVQDFLDEPEKKSECHRVVEALGGVGNIKMITSSSVSIVAILIDNNKIDIEKLLETRAYKVRERYFGYYIDYGPGAASLAKQIKKDIKAYNECLEFHSEG